MTAKHNKITITQINITPKDRLGMLMDGITPFPFDQFAVAGVGYCPCSEEKEIKMYVSVIKLGKN